MPCDRPKTQLYFYLDGELAPPEAAAVEAHLQRCPACQQEATAHRRLQALLRTALGDDETPPHLWPTIQQALARDAARRAAQRRAGWRRRLWLGTGALAALVLLALAVRLWTAAPVPVVVQELVDSQVRARLMEVPYHPLPPTPGAIRQWFQDKVEFPILVPNLSPQRYRFVGVRLNYFLNRRVAEMAYAVSDRTLAFLMFPDQGLALPARHTVRMGERTLFVHRYKGYSAVLWKDGDFFCGLVSDLDPEALLQVAREAITPPAAS